MRLPRGVIAAYDAGMANTSGTLWAGLALRRMRAAADPDAAPRPVALPAAWDDGGWSEAVLGDGPGGRDNAVVQDGAGMALAALGAGQGAVSLPRLAEGWIGRLLARGRRLSLLPPEAEAPLA
ncbi:MAG: hypothetical protein JWP20_1129, partial [Roseomonas sp.]|nr:hypothetical protein [Roseomonas sp.]